MGETFWKKFSPTPPSKTFEGETFCLHEHSKEKRSVQAKSLAQTDIFSHIQKFLGVRGPFFKKSPAGCRGRALIMRNRSFRNLLPASLRLATVPTLCYPQGGRIFVCTNIAKKKGLHKQNRLHKPICFPISKSFWGSGDLFSKSPRRGVGAEP